MLEHISKYQQSETVTALKQLKMQFIYTTMQFVGKTFSKTIKQSLFVYKYVAIRY